MQGDQTDTEKIIAFLREIGIAVHYEKLHEKTFVPGIVVRNGAIYIDRETMDYPGDLLHEAGHLAVLQPEERAHFPEIPPGVDSSGNHWHQKAGGDEMAAIAWSWAALMHLGLKPELLFHEGGYKGDSEWLIENFTEKKYLGLPLLCWMGFCADEKNAEAQQVKPYPYMRRWMRV
jgi:hypothetical protein